MSEIKRIGDFPKHAKKPRSSSTDPARESCAALDAQKDKPKLTQLAGDPNEGNMIRAIVCSQMTICMFLLGGCSSTRNESVTPALGKVAPSYPVEGLVGRWGVASYRNEKDRPRTEAMARVQCRLPYVVTKGPTDGVMMHVADDATLYELTLKGSGDGKTFLGFDSPPGDPQDREILSFSDKLIVMQYANPETHARYGTFVYTRCA